MNIKKILIISLIALAVIASVSAVSAGWFDGLFGEQQKDNVVELDDMTFNTTNATNFNKFVKPSEDENLKITIYNGTGNYILVSFDYSEYYKIDNSSDELMMKGILDGMKDTPYQVVNGIVIYPSAPVYHNESNIRQMFTASVQDTESHKIIMLSSPDPNETSKMASTLKFK